MMDTRSRWCGRNTGIIREWENGRCGELLFLKELSEIQFIECEYFSDNNLHYKYIGDSRTIENCPLCAHGIIAHIIWYREGMDEVKLYELYYTPRLNNYIQKEKQKFGSFKRDLCKDFYMTHSLQERESIVKSELIWEYLGNEEKRITMKYVECYFEYLARILNVDSLEDEKKENNNIGIYVQEKKKQVIFPKELDTDVAREIFNKAIKAGLMEKTSFGFKWLKTKALLAYFVDMMSDSIDIKPSNGNVPWSVFKPLFGIDTKDNSLKDARNEYKNKFYNRKPEDSDIIESLFI